MEKVYIIAITAYVVIIATYLLILALGEAEKIFEEKAEKRRAESRARAYQKIRERRRLQDNRHELWKQIKK